MLRQVLYPIDSKWVEWGDCKGNGGFLLKK